MATFEKSGLSCAKSAQCVKLEDIGAVFSWKCDRGMDNEKPARLVPGRFDSFVDSGCWVGGRSRFVALKLGPAFILALGKKRFKSVALIP